MTQLPPHLPVPEDDGACAHLPGMSLPPVELEGATGGTYRLDQQPTRWLVLYLYPRTGRPGEDPPDGWDLIPGARGCTPQSCAFRDHHAELTTLNATVYGVSAQPIHEQREFTERMHIPFPLLNDSGLVLADEPLRLPTFEFGGWTLYRRLTLCVEEGTIRKVFYPVFPPDRNASEVLAYLRSV